MTELPERRDPKPVTHGLADDVAEAMRRLDESLRPARERVQEVLASTAPVLEQGAAAVRRALNRAADALQPLIRVAARYYDHLDRIARDLEALVPLAREGWALSVFGLLMTPDAHERAAAVVAEDEAQAARELLAGWSDAGAQMVACSLVPYAYPADRRPLADRRRALLERAVEHFRNERYEAVVLLIYSQLDGIFQDKADELGNAAFSRLFSRSPVKGAGSEQFSDLVRRSGTVLGEEESFFLLVREGMTSPVSTSTLDDHPSRHGVLHGRVLGYGTQTRAAQAFAFLAASMELLAALQDEIPLTSEEARETELEAMPVGFWFRMQAVLHAPVRAVFVANRERALAFAADDRAARRRGA